MRYRPYTGIGNRQLPGPLRPVLRKFGATLASLGFTLRSGGAEGSDEEFEQGCVSQEGAKEIFLPWKAFRDKKGEGYLFSRELDYEGYQRAKRLAEKYHPAWGKLNDQAKMFHTRNVHQVLGLNGLTPSQFLLCYDNVNASTGTKQALRIAEDLGIKVYNFYKEEDLKEAVVFLKQLCAAA